MTDGAAFAEKTPSKMDVAPWDKHWIKRESRFNGIRRDSMVFNGIRRDSMIFNGIRRDSIIFNGIRGD